MTTEQPSLWRILTQRKSKSRVPTEQRSRARFLWISLSRRRIVFWACALVMTIGVGVYLRAEIYRRVSRFSNDFPRSSAKSGGTLMIVGGGHMPDMVRQQFIELAGRERARIVVIPAMSIELVEFPEYREPWCSLNVESVEVLHATSRAEAEDPDFSKMLESATGVWLAGGQQSWLAKYYGQTIVETRLKELLGRNGVIGGTSAGAAIMSAVMIAGGQQKPVIAQGFGLIQGAIIDQHFLKRNRFRRLQNALEQHPDLIGFGIDEGTALLYGVESGQFRIVGQSSVVACVPHVESDSHLNLQLEFMNPGDEFDVARLRRGEPVPPSIVDLDSILLGE